MTVCVAAFAADSSAIVCIADKAISYGDYIQWDADSSKIIKLTPSGVVALVSGEEDCISRVINKLADNSQLGQHLHDTAAYCEKSYQDSSQELIEATFLRPRLLTRAEYVAAISGTEINQYIHGVAGLVDDYKMQCEVLLCGIDARPESYILWLSRPGVITDMTRTGFHAIGSGWEHAASRMLWSETKRSQPIERVLYDAFDAKANAEMAVGVGYEWDAEIIIQGNVDTVSVPDNIKKLIEQVWAKSNRSPFQLKKEPDDFPDPPAKWRDKLREWTDSIATAKS